MPENTETVAVTLTQQQIDLLDKIKSEGGHGSSYPEIVMSLFRAYARHAFGDGRFAPVHGRDS
jgi:hypothetical protein